MMWDVLLAAGVGALVSLLGWGAKNAWEGRRNIIKARRQYVADVLDSNAIQAIDSFSENAFDFRAFFATTQALPVPPTLVDIELDGELSVARQLISDQIRDLYDLRVSENQAGQAFSDRFDAEVLAFRKRLISWARGKIGVNDIFRMLP
ncbi:hypothetical protein ACFZA2_01705 [Microbacterium sp. NPDC007973]|uniref:hypothetical protein n=1 Tax=Microbacterium sp. NPDC007973 TaxID=3364182 RepID=UPI0036ED3D92